jgi:hypothetical protein
MLATYESIISPAYTADGTALANSTTNTDISPSPPTIVPAMFLDVPGQIVTVRAGGRFSTAVATNLTLGVYWGGAASGVSLGNTGALATTTVTNQTWWLEFRFQVRAIGTAGSVLGLGTAQGVTGATAMNAIPATAPTAATIDTTTAKTLTVAALWSVANAGNTITCHIFHVEATL